MNNNSSHVVKLIDRKNISISCVNKVISFDDKEFSLDCNMGNILIKGTDLEMTKLDTIDGNLMIKGNIDSITYNNVNNKESLLTKLFK